MDGVRCDAQSYTAMVRFGLFPNYPTQNSREQSDREFLLITSPPVFIFEQNAPEYFEVKGNGEKGGRIGFGGIRCKPISA